MCMHSTRFLKETHSILGRNVGLGLDECLAHFHLPVERSKVQRSALALIDKPSTCSQLCSRTWARGEAEAQHGAKNDIEIERKQVIMCVAV